jgi:hypothetical protein
MGKVKILFLAANPDDKTRLALDEEIRSIEEAIHASEHRDLIEVVQKHAVRPDDLQKLLLKEKPHVVHFSGHGSKYDELILKNDAGTAAPVRKDAIVDLFGILKDNIRLVVLNACYSKPQAEAIVDVIDCAIGMNAAIGDEAAIKFATSLYLGIGYGRTIDEAFRLGRNAIMVFNIPDDQTPELLSNKDANPATIKLINPQ